MTVGRHDQRSTIRVPQLDSYVSVRHTKPEKVCRAEVTQLVEIHPGTTERRPHRVPVVVETALAEAPATRRDKQPGLIETRWNTSESLTPRRRQCHDPLQPILR